MPCLVKHYQLDLTIIPGRMYVVTGKEMLARAALSLGLSHVPGVQDMLVPEEVNNFRGMFLNLGGHNYLLVLPEEYDAGTTYHECLHAANSMWYDIGAELTSHNDEVIAYTMNYLASFIEDNCYGG